MNIEVQWRHTYPNQEEKKNEKRNEKEKNKRKREQRIRVWLYVNICFKWIY